MSKYNRYQLSFQKLFVGIAALLLSITCFAFPGSEDVAQVTKEIDVYHARQNDMKFKEIYNDLHSDIKKVIPEKEFVDHLAKFKESYGLYESGLLIKSTVSDAVFGERKVIILYRSKYAKETIKEEFTFKKSGDGKWAIAKYAYGI